MLFVTVNLCLVCSWATQLAAEAKEKEKEKEKRMREVEAEIRWWDEQISVSGSRAGQI
jgi:hypothetical protein